MSLWSDFIPLVAMEAPGCPRFELEEVAKRLTIEFYQETRAWRVEGVTLGTTVANQAEYTVTNPTATDLAGLPAVWIDDVEAPETRPGTQDDGPRSTSSSTNSVGVVAINKIRLSPPPDAAGRVIKATVAYKPGDAATGIDDQLFRDHWQAIRCKILAHLLMQPGKPWTDMKAAGYYENKYATEGCDVSADAGPLKRNPLRVKLSRY